MNSEKLRHALIVEDLPDTRLWLIDVLTMAFPGIEIGTSASLTAGMQSLREHTPDIALIDLDLPDGSGIDLVREINSCAPACHAVVTTIFDDDNHLFPALQAGARGYLLKDQARERLVTMLQGIIQGQPPLSPSIARRLLNHFQPSSQASDTDIALTARETEVLRLIAKGYTTGRTAELLGISAHTASGYIKEIYRKLKINNRAEATLEAARRGLIRPD